MSVRAAPLDLATLDTLAVDAYAVFVGADERPLIGLAGLIDWRMAGGLTRLLDAKLLTGAAAESLLTTTTHVPGPRLFVFGLGPGATTAERFAAEAQRAAGVLAKARVGRLALGLPEFPPAPIASRILRAALEGLPAEVHLLGG